MKSPFRSYAQFGVPSMLSTVRTAHSGPELVSAVPQPGLARELAQALVAEHIELTAEMRSRFAGSYTPEFNLSLARR